MRSTATNNNIWVYLWSLVFIVPVFISMVSSGSSVRNADYILVILFLIYTYKTNLLARIDEVTYSNRSLQVFFGSVLFALIYSQLSQYYSFNVNAIDHSAFDTMMQEALKGNIGYSACAGYNHLAIHQNYILLLVLPIYYLFPYTPCLLISIAFVIWLAGIFLWKIARLLKLNHVFSLLCVLYFYLSPLNVMQNGFLPELFYPLGVFMLYYTYLRGRLLYFIMAVMFFLAIKEDAPLYLLGFGLFLLVKRDFKCGFIVFILTFMVMGLNIKLVQPHYLLVNHMENPTYIDYWYAWGYTKDEIIATFIHHPFKVLAYCFNKDSGFWWLYMPVLYIPLFNPMVLFSSGLPLFLFLSGNPKWQAHVLLNYYPITLNAFLILGMLIFTAKVMTKARIDKSVKPLWLCLVILLTAPLWQGSEPHFYHIDFKRLQDFRQVTTILKNDYPDKKICAGGNVYPHLLIREYNTGRYLGWFLNRIPPDKFITYNDCIVVLSAQGKNAPYEEDIGKMTDYARSRPDICHNIGDFWYCDNYSVKRIIK